MLSEYDYNSLPSISARETCGPVLQAAEHGRTDLGFIALRCV